MPLVPASDDLGLRDTLGAEPIAEPPPGDPFAAAFRRDNSFVAAVHAARNSTTFRPQPGYNPLDAIKDTKYEEAYRDRFVGVRSEQEAISVMGSIEREEADAKTLQANGALGTLAGFAAGILDPTNALPVGAAVSAGRAGFSFGRAALSVGRAAVVQTTAAEAVLQGTQETRTTGESLLNIGSATLLGAFLGGALSRLTPLQKLSLEGAVNHARIEMDAHARGAPVPASFDVYHGSPHDFDAFDNGRIGTGEGAQVYGHGLYFAESQDVAKVYRDQLTDRHNYGEEFWDALPAELRELGDRHNETSLVRAIFNRQDGWQDLLAKKIESSLAIREQLKTDKNLAEAISPDRNQRLIDLLEGVRDNGTQHRPPGKLYRVLVKADREQFLDWDQLLGEQPQGVQDAVSKVRGRAGVELTPDMTGEDVMAFLRAKVGPEDTAKIMRDAGIPGVRYLDQGSRGKDGVTTRNFVVFDNRLLHVTHKDGHDIMAGISPIEGAAESSPAPLSAAATDTRQLNLVKTGLEFSAGLSPTRRVLSSESMVARRAMTDLAETPYRFEEGAEGIAATQGPALSRLVKIAIDGGKVGASDEINRLFSDYRFGASDTRLPVIRSQIADVFGQAGDKLSAKQFREEVGAALRNGDTHDIPQVAQAAQFLRRKVFDPWKERAVAAGMLPEGIEAGTAESYFTRVWNKEMIRAARPEFVNTVTDWLASDQGIKAQIQQRLGALQSELEGLRAKIEKGGDAAEAAATRHDHVRGMIEDQIGQWHGKSAAEAKSAIKAREKYASAASREPGAKRLTSADVAIDKAVKRILDSDRNLDRGELRSRAQEITDRVIGSPDGRLPYDAPTGGPRIGGQGGTPPRGALAARDFMIPDATVEKYMENDAEKVAGLYLRTMVPDVLLTERFGDVDMTPTFRSINDDYAARIDGAKSEKQRVALGKERDAVIRDLAATRDRIRGVFGFSPDLRNMARVATAAKSINNITSMGSSAISSLSDFAGAVFRHGIINVMSDGWAPFFKGLTSQGEAFREFKGQMRALGIGVETAINARQHAIDDVLETYQPQSRFERTLQAVSDKFFLANFLTPLTDAQKVIAAHVSVSEMLRAAKAVQAGNATKRQIANLAESGIDPQMATRIAEQFATGGEVRDGVHLPNTADWRDQGAAMALNGAVAREVDIAVVSPGMEKPLWMSQPVMSLLGQFKSFTAASTERILIANLQRRDAYVLQGLFVSVSLGMMSYAANAATGGTPASARPQDWIKEGISRSGVMGWFEEGNALTSKLTRGGVDVYRMIGADKPLTRFASRSALDMFLGPTAAKMESVAKLTGAASSGDWGESDTKALRRLIPFQNLFYLRTILDQVERGANNAMGVEMKASAQ